MERIVSDYQISQGTIPDPINAGVIRVWSAFTPSGERIMNGEMLHFYQALDAMEACWEHMHEGRAAA